MTSQTQARIADCVTELGADWAVLSGPDAVCYATGQPMPIETGPSPFSGGPALALVSRDGTTGLICSNVEGGATGVQAEIYAGFAGSVTDQISNYRAAVHRLVARLGVGGRLAVQMRSHPAQLSDLLPGPFVGINRLLDRARAVKTPSELTRLARAGQITAAAQTACRALSRVGASEVEVLNGIRAVIEQAAGTRCALAGEFLGGIEHTAALGTPPGARRLQQDDPVVCDLAPRIDGYWGDSCAAFVVGEPSAGWLAMFDRCHDTLRLAQSIIRPGMKISELDAALRTHMAAGGYSYPHHSGHGVGTSVHEWPRIVPDEPALIEENMVLMVEPGSYVPGLGGARTEYMLRVTATGTENLTDFPLGPL